MIMDNIRNASKYYCIGDAFAKALRYLQTEPLADKPVGDYELEGRAIYVMVRDYETKTPDKGRWEAHRKHADVQFVVSGRERMGYSLAHAMKDLGDYNPDKDTYHLEGKGDFVEMSEGCFAIFLPGEIHMPAMAIDDSRMVRKVIVKVLCG